MPSKTFQLPDDVRARLGTLGAAGAAWVDGLSDAVDGLARDWGVRVGAVLTGGSESLVLEAVRADGSPAILKLRVPGAAEMTAEIEALRIADGRGYARLLNYDEARDALLLERLGAPLASRQLPWREELEVLVETLQTAWVPAPLLNTLPTAAAKADWLRTFIETTYTELDEPCDRRIITHVLAYAEERGDALDPSHCVLAHADPHSHNALADPGAPSGYRFIDPDGLFAEPAYDLGVLLREGNADFLSGDPLPVGRKLCEQLAAQTGADPHAIWQWANVERVSTGLMCLKMGLTQEGRDTLAVAAAWAES